MESAAEQPIRKLHHRLFVMGAGLLVMLVIILAVLWFSRPQKPLPFTSSLARQVNFPLYYANPLPSGYARPKADEAAYSNHVLTFTYSDAAGHRLAITEQAKPAQFDFSQLTGDKQFYTRYGKATYHISDSQTVASLITDQTWVLVTAPVALSNSDTETLLTNFRPASK